MKVKAQVFLTVLALAITLPASSWAATSYIWNIPDNMRIVQKDTLTANNPRMFNNIASAITSCTTMANNTPTNRCQVKIMPGKYDLGSGSLTLPSDKYIDLEGSGQDSTLITSTSPLNGRVFGSGGIYATGAVLTVNGDSHVRNLTVANTNSAGGLAIRLAGTAEVENVTAQASGLGSGDMNDYGAFLVPDSTANVKLSHVTAIAASTALAGGGDVGGILCFGGVGTISHANIFVSGGAWTSAVYMDSGGEIADSKILIDAVPNGGHGISVSLAPVTITNTIVRVTGIPIPPYFTALYQQSAGALKVLNSSISLTSGTEGRVTQGGTYCNCKIDGGVGGSPERLTNCYDGDGVPLPNYP
ncbi:MAG TPA: hypothetical protein VN317_00060 [Candidatus Methanoperedens sp.]|nr:hypothetical protein [Candidatus Methanoperedens sp.]